MQNPNNSLRSRLTTLVIVAIFGSVTIVTASSVSREIGQYGNGRKAELEASATVFAYAIADHVRSQNKPAALEALRTISRFPAIEFVRVEDASGDLFVELGGGEMLTDTSQPESTALLPNSIAKDASVVSVPIINSGDIVGVLWVYADSSQLSERITTLIWDAVYAALFAAGIGLLIALRMQRAVTRPIHNLSNIMNSVRTTGDFGNRAKRISNDEIGELVDSFNEMLDQIQERDAKLLAHQQNLKKIVRQRTKQFEDAKEIAEAANSAKSEFLATMSHEIRTPMNGMLVMAELLNNAPLAPRQKRYADVIVKSGQSLISIINDILDFSKIEAGRLELESIDVNPVDVIHDVVGLFWERASSSGIDLAAYVGPDVPHTIKCDPVRLNQVLSNLVNNALKFTEKGSVVVSAKMLKNDNDVDLIEFSVTDTGVGIASEKQKAIFEAFSQADQTTTRKFGGTGLGLAICSKILKAMKGDISVASIEGKGSRFFFNFPVTVAEPARPFVRLDKEMRAIIAIDGVATPRMLSRYLHEAGISSQIVAPQAVFASHMAYADIIFASPAFLNTFKETAEGGPDQWIPTRICVSELGDAAPDRLLEAGVAEDLIIKPLSRYDVMEQIERVDTNTLRGERAVSLTGSHDAALPVFSSKRVLAADDSAVNREVVSAALVRLGLEPILVENGREALEATRKENVDLILMDCSMPEMDGFEATRAIRKREQDVGTARTPIIALTAHVAQDETEWRSAGMDNYLTKPFTIKTLADALSHYLDHENSSAHKTHIVDESEVAIEPLMNAPFDVAVLESLDSMDSEHGGLAARALRLFGEHSKDAMLRVAASLKGDDAAEIKSAAHALKSMSYNVGAMALGDACSALETSDPESADYGTLMKALKRTFVSAHEALAETIARYEKAAA